MASIHGEHVYETLGSIPSTLNNLNIAFGPSITDLVAQVGSCWV
jgi:hypothetical protein